MRAILMLWCLMLTGCFAPPQADTSFLRGVDLVNMTDRMAESFAGNDIIGSRTAADEPWVISINRIVNHTNQIIPDREKWLYIGRLRARLAQSPIAEQRSIIWVIPPERWPIVAEELGVSQEPYGLRLAPTHLLTAEFNALTSSSSGGRSDAYVCAYQLLDLNSGTIVWEDMWEVKRQVTGLTFD